MRRQRCELWHGGRPLPRAVANSLAFAGADGAPSARQRGAQGWLETTVMFLWGSMPKKNKNVFILESCFSIVVPYMHNWLLRSSTPISALVTLPTLNWHMGHS